MFGTKGEIYERLNYVLESIDLARKLLPKLANTAKKQQLGEITAALMQLNNSKKQIKEVIAVEGRIKKILDKQFGKG